MAADKTAVEQKSIPVAGVVIALVVILGAGFFVYLDRLSHRPPPPPAALTSQAKAYVRSLRLLDVDMQKHESYLKQAVENGYDNGREMYTMSVPEVLEQVDAVIAEVRHSALLPELPVMPGS